MQPSIPRWMILALGVVLVGFGIASSMGWLQDPSLTRSDFIGVRFASFISSTSGS